MVAGLTAIGLVPTSAAGPGQRRGPEAAGSRGRRGLFPAGTPRPAAMCDGSADLLRRAPLKLVLAMPGVPALY
jgi:hypothetical protein